MEEPDSPSKMSLERSVSYKEEEDDFEDVPEEQYQEMLKAMALKKEQDEANQVEGRENFDYSVPRRRKKQLISEQAIENSPPKLPKKDTIDSDLLEWIK